MNDEVKIVNEFDRDGHHFKIGVNADGQVSIYIDDETKLTTAIIFQVLFRFLRDLNQMEN